MAEDTPKETPKSPSPHRGKRKIRNMLIDKGIQLRLTFSSMLIIATMCVSLGVVLTWQHNDAKRFFDQQRAKATKMFKRQLNENTRLIKSIRQQSTADMTKLLSTATGMLDVQLKDKDEATREMAKLAKDALLKDDKARIKRRKSNDARLIRKRRQIDKESVNLRKHQDLEASILDSGQFTLTIALLVMFCFLLLILIFVFSIRTTHRVAGPIFKIGRYIDAIRDNQIGEIHDLRKTDLLQSFHERFKQMHEAIKSRTEEDIALLAKLEAFCEEHGGEGEAIEELQEALAAKRAAIGGATGGEAEPAA